MRARVIVPVLLALVMAVGLVAAAQPLEDGSVSARPRTPDPSTSASASPSSSTAGSASPAPAPTGSPRPSVTPTPSASPTSAGSGVSTPGREVADLYPVTRLAPGEAPPQFVVVSFDGACLDELWKHYLALAQDTGARFTFFLSGLCLLPDAKRQLYRPPHKPVGYSAIGFGAAKRIPERIRNLGTAYEQGHEIGTHFLGHFCDARGVGTWTRADWASEVAQARTFLDRWAELNGSTDPRLRLPFDSSVWQGERTPCLAGRRSELYPALAANGFRYDASNPGTLVWPRRVVQYDLWTFPLQRIKVVGYGRSNLSMDYNLLFAQNGGRTDAPPATCDRIRRSTYESLVQALAAVEGGNRAPFFVGNHFNTWACGAYKDALTSFIRDTRARHPEVRFVTNEYLVRWLDAQDPAVLRALQERPAPRY